MVPIIVGVAGIIAAALLCVVLIKAANKYRQNKLSKCSQPVQGTCNHIETVLDKRGCYIYVHFDYCYNGQTFSDIRNCDEKIVSWLKKGQALTEIKNNFEAGKEYTIYVDPDKPNRFKIFK